MEKSINAAIKLLAEQVTANMDSNDALKFTQAALNLAHVLATQASTEAQRKIHNI